MARATPPSSQPLTRDVFTLTGPSIPIDPRTHAVRGDLADIRLARQVFAPHYAAPMIRTLVMNSPLREGRDPASPILTELDAGDVFEVLELTDDVAWGTAPGRKLVGYLDRLALEHVRP